MSEENILASGRNKYAALLDYLTQMGSVAVAFSGGVDSTFLLKAARTALNDNVLAITVVTRSYPARELEATKEFCDLHGIRQVIYPFNELEIDSFCQNPPNRCYICKRAIFRQILSIAAQENIRCVAEGSNIDDDGDYRPGMQAIAELNIQSPLRQAKLCKDEIRLLSREMALPTWDKPSMACLASRFPYGEVITVEKLSMVERAENFLLDKGFSQVRVRMHGQLARIELPLAELDLLSNVTLRQEILAALKEIGFVYVTLDLAGYRTGSLNEVLSKK